LFFLIVAPYQDKGNRYLPVLGSIVELVSQDDIRQRMMAAESFEELGAILEGA
jgi:mannitol/fructose-specific phosphotransferase system IIA component (Ntr-type)